MNDFKQVASYLPPIVQEMMEVIGFEATEQLVRKLGGTPIRFSYGEHYFPRLVEAIGQKSAEKLQHHFDREVLYLPRCAIALRIMRNQRFVAEFERLRDEGVSGRMAMLTLCPKYGISDRQGWAIVKGLHQSSEPISQGILF